MSNPPGYEHTAAMQEAFDAAATLRKRIKRLHWIAGGAGYDNMGKRELEQARARMDEAMHWLNAASSSLLAGGKRAKGLGHDTEAAA